MRRPTSLALGACEILALETGAAKLGVALGTREVRLLEKYVADLDRWNRRVNLVSCRTPGEFVERHLLDSLAAARFVREGAEGADLGSGAGLPGIPLAIVTGARWTLVEPRERRASFLRSVARSLELDHVVVVGERAEELAKRGWRWDLVTARAVWKPERFLEIATRMLRAGGMAVAFVGGREAVEENSERFRLVGRVEVGAGARRVEGYEFCGS